MRIATDTHTVDIHSHSCLHTLRKSASLRRAADVTVTLEHPIPLDLLRKAFAYVLDAVQPGFVRIAGSHAAHAMPTLARVNYSRKPTLHATTLIDASCFPGLMDAVSTWTKTDWLMVLTCSMESWMFLLEHAVVHGTAAIPLSQNTCLRPFLSNTNNVTEDVRRGAIEIVHTRVVIDISAVITTEVVLPRARHAQTDTIAASARSWLWFAHNVRCFRTLLAANGEVLGRNYTLEEYGLDDETSVVLVDG